MRSKRVRVDKNMRGRHHGKWQSRWHALSLVIHPFQCFLLPNSTRRLSAYRFLSQLDSSAASLLPARRTVGLRWPANTVTFLAQLRHSTLIRYSRRKLIAAISSLYGLCLSPSQPSALVDGSAYATIPVRTLPPAIF